MRDLDRVNFLHFWKYISVQKNWRILYAIAFILKGRCNSRDIDILKIAKNFWFVLACPYNFSRVSRELISTLLETIPEIRTGRRLWNLGSKILEFEVRFESVITLFQNSSFGEHAPEFELPLHQ